MSGTKRYQNTIRCLQERNNDLHGTFLENLCTRVGDSAVALQKTRSHWSLYTRVPSLGHLHFESGGLRKSTSTPSRGISGSPLSHDGCAIF